MGKINDLSQGNLGEIARQQHRDQYATPLNGSSVGSGGMRFYGEGSLRVENEGLIVTGVASISGSLSVTGTLTQAGTSTFTGTTRFTGQTDIWGPLTVTGETDLDGPTTITGALTVTGLTKLNGDTTVAGKLDVTGAMATKGTLSVEGVTTLKNDLRVEGGGKITAGQMTINPTANGGSIQFPNNQTIYSTASRLVAASLQLTGTLEVTNSVTFKGLQSTTQEANVYINPATGVLYYTS